MSANLEKNDVEQPLKPKNLKIMEGIFIYHYKIPRFFLFFTDLISSCISRLGDQNQEMSPPRFTPSIFNYDRFPFS